MKELIPEFFYMPEFLVNTNSYHFGVRQDGEPLGDVFLPTWAKVCKSGTHYIDFVYQYERTKLSLI